MRLSRLIGPDDVVIRPNADSKKQVLEDMVRLISARRVEFDERTVAELLFKRERLGSTGIGDGVAIPHARCPFPDSSADDMAGLLMRLDKPVSFDANDDQPVDIIFMLLASPRCGTEHLTMLASISRFVRDEKVTTAIRKAATPETIWRLLEKPSFADAA